MKQVKIFDGYDPMHDVKMNDFMAQVDVIDVKMNTVVANTGNFFSRYLVIYKPLVRR